MKNVLTLGSGEINLIESFGWSAIQFLYYLESRGEFPFFIPLRLWLGFAEDYKQIILNVKQELVLLHDTTVKNAVSQKASADF